MTPCAKGWPTGQSRISNCPRWRSKASRSLTMAVPRDLWLLFGSDLGRIPMPLSHTAMTTDDEQHSEAQKVGPVRQGFSRRHATENRPSSAHAPVDFTDVACRFKTAAIEWGLHLLVVRNVSLAQSALKLAGILVLQPVFVVLRRFGDALRVQANAVRYITFQFLGQFEGIP